MCIRLLLFRQKSIYAHAQRKYLLTEMCSSCVSYGNNLVINIIFVGYRIKYVYYNGLNGMCELCVWVRFGSVLALLSIIIIIIMASIKKFIEQPEVISFSSWLTVWFFFSNSVPSFTCHTSKMLVKLFRFDNLQNEMNVPVVFVDLMLLNFYLIIIN